MTRTTNARLAGFLFLFYIVVAMPSMVLFFRATSGEGIPAKLASIAQHAPQLRLSILLSLLTVIIAWTLAVSLYAITRDQDKELAILAMSCRFGEGVMGAVVTVTMLGLLWVGTEASAAAPDPGTAHALAALLLQVRASSWIVAAAVFAVGSALFSYLFLRARSIPVPLSWLGIFASLLLVVGLPAQLVGWLEGPAADMYIWLPMFAFEVWLALWLLIKGVAMPPTRQSPPAHGERVHARD